MLGFMIGTIGSIYYFSEHAEKSDPENKVENDNEVQTQKRNNISLAVILAVFLIIFFIIILIA